MNLLAQHPSTRALLKWQRRAYLKRMTRGFRSPRRIVLSSIAVVLATLWIGQAIAGVFLREAADPLRLFNWLVLGLTGYAIWNVLKVVFRKPVEPFEWTTAEKEWLGSAPLARADLVRYRLASISSAALVKSAIFTLVMIPDLQLLPVAFIGIYIGLMMIELIRAIMEIVFFGMTVRERLFARIVAGLVTSAAMVWVGFWFYNQWHLQQFSELFSAEFIQCTTRGLQQLPGTMIGKIVCAPFAVLANVIVAESLSVNLILIVLVWVGVLFSTMRLLEKVDVVMSSRSKYLERIGLQELIRTSNLRKLSTTNLIRRVRKAVPHVGGLGCLIWRQMNGVNHYRGTVLVALMVPLILAVSPAIGSESGWRLVEQIIVMIACYSFLLLPTALKFDFRRDLDRINVLKALPLSPMTITLGQLAVPVLISSCFQFIALLFAMLINPFHPGFLVMSMVLLIPLNVFIFGLENLMFLLYPYRINGEGIQIFLRTILAFTAKGILMGIGLAFGFGFLLLSILAGNHFAQPELASASIFGLSAGLAMTALSTVVVRLLSRTFQRLDTSRDLSVQH